MDHWSIFISDASIRSTLFESMCFDNQWWSHSSIQVEEFSIQSNGAGVRLEIRHARTSVSDRLLLIFGAQTVEQLLAKQPQDGFVRELNDDNWLNSGFYVRLRGFIGALGAIELTYAQFYRWTTPMCPGGVDEFHCDNSRCIKQVSDIFEVLRYSSSIGINMRCTRSLRWLFRWRQSTMSRSYCTNWWLILVERTSTKFI